MLQLLVWALAICIADQAAKRLAWRAGVRPRVAWGFMHRVSPLIAGLVWIAAATAIATWSYLNAPSELVQASLGIVLGGAGSNALDRVTLGGVLDYVPVAGTVSNLGDAAIVAGLVGLLLSLFVAF